MFLGTATAVEAPQHQAFRARQYDSLKTSRVECVCPQMSALDSKKKLPDQIVSNREMYSGGVRKNHTVALVGSFKH